MFPCAYRVKDVSNKEVLGILVSYRVKVKLVVSRGGWVCPFDTEVLQTLYLYRTSEDLIQTRCLLLVMCQWSCLLSWCTPSPLNSPTLDRSQVTSQVWHFVIIFTCVCVYYYYWSKFLKCIFKCLITNIFNCCFFLLFETIKQQNNLLL